MVHHPLLDPEEGHAERVKVEKSAEVSGNLQAALNHPLQDHEESHAERVNVEQSAHEH